MASPLLLSVMEEGKQAVATLIALKEQRNYWKQREGAEGGRSVRLVLQV